MSLRKIPLYVPVLVYTSLMVCSNNNLQHVYLTEEALKALVVLMYEYDVQQHCTLQNLVLVSRYDVSKTNRTNKRRTLPRVTSVLLRIPEGVWKSRHEALRGNSFQARVARGAVCGSAIAGGLFGIMSLYQGDTLSECMTSSCIAAQSYCALLCGGFGACAGAFAGASSASIVYFIEKAIESQPKPLQRVQFALQQGFVWIEIPTSVSGLSRKKNQQHSHEILFMDAPK